MHSYRDICDHLIKTKEIKSDTIGKVIRDYVKNNPSSWFSYWKSMEEGNRPIKSPDHDETKESEIFKRQGECGTFDSLADEGQKVTA